MSEAERTNEGAIWRYLRGDCSAAERDHIRERMERESDFAARVETAERLWFELELPPTSPPPPGFAARVAAHARSRKGTAVPLAEWFPAALALLLGVILGTGLAWDTPTTESDEAESISLAESYLTAAADAAVAADFPVATGNPLGFEEQR